MQIHLGGSESVDLLLEAVNISHNNRISFYDACYLVLALRLGCRMATADRKLREKVSGYGVVDGVASRT